MSAISLFGLMRIATELQCTPERAAEMIRRWSEDRARDYHATSCELRDEPYRDDCPGCRMGRRLSC